MRDYCSHKGIPGYGQFPLAFQFWYILQGIKVYFVLLLSCKDTVWSHVPHLSSMCTDRCIQSALIAASCVLWLVSLLEAFKPPKKRHYLLSWNAVLKSFAKSMHPYCDFLLNYWWTKADFPKPVSSIQTTLSNTDHVDWPERCSSVMNDGCFIDLRGTNNINIAQYYAHNVV